MLDEYVVFDTETTGLDAKTNEIIEIGAVKVKNGVVVDKFISFCKPTTHIPNYITNINGITDDMVADFEPPEVIVAEFMDFVGELPILAYNLPFDYRFLCNTIDIDDNHKGLDVLKIAREVLGSQTVNHKLGTVSEFFGIELEEADHSRGFHSALYDAIVTKIIYERLCKLTNKEYLPETLTDTDRLARKQREGTQNAEKLSYV